MDQSNVPGFEKESGRDNRLVDFQPLFALDKSSPSQDSEGPEVKIGRTIAAFDFGSKTSTVEVFTMTLGEETIELLPQKNWAQLDRYKWTAQGKLPGQPSGLEIGLDNVHFAGKTLSPRDAEACAKLQQLLNDWLVLERETARKKACGQVSGTAPEPPAQPDPAALRFRVEVDKRGQVHVHCVQDKQILASIGLSTAGFNSLFQQGFMRKAREVHTGVLHDWVELDGDLCSFENGKNDAARLEQILNERYLPSGTFSRGKEVLVLVNAASSTGFDIQFPATVGGVSGSHRHHLDEQSLELLQDKQRCGLLHDEIIIKAIAPNLVFKWRTPEGGEQYLAPHPDNLVIFTDDDGKQTRIDLSQPVNFLHLRAPELTAVFNHPSISRYSKSLPMRPEASLAAAPAVRPQTIQTQRPQTSAARPISKPVDVAPPLKPESSAREHQPSRGPLEAAITGAGAPAAKHAETPRRLPNLWLKDLLSQAAVRHDWLAPLAYRKMARHFGRSSEGSFGASPCWFISLNEETNVAAPAFKGVFLTEKGGLGFLGRGHVVRFNNGVAFVGRVESTHEGLDVNLVGLGLTARNEVAFIPGDNYQSKFEVPTTTFTELLKQLSESGAVILSISETLASHDPIEVLWTLPAEHPDPNNPQVLESRRPTI